jgi:hypothetical protein
MPNTGGINCQKIRLLIALICNVIFCPYQLRCSNALLNRVTSLWPKTHNGANATNARGRKTRASPLVKIVGAMSDVSNVAAKGLSTEHGDRLGQSTEVSRWPA